MTNRTGTDVPPINYASDNPGYQQAVANAAYIVHQIVGGVYKDMVDGDWSEFQNIIEGNKLLKEGLGLDENAGEAITSLDQVSRVFPLIGEEYGILDEDILMDFTDALDYYEGEFIRKMLDDFPNLFTE